MKDSGDIAPVCARPGPDIGFRLKQNALRALFLCGLSLSGCSSTTNYPRSDHFDGKRFFNPTLKEELGAWKILKLLLTIRFEDWPERVENDPPGNLHVPLEEDHIAVTFINHATVLIQARGISILTDPVWSERVSPWIWFGPKRVRDPGIALEDLPPIDVVIISHNHYDHMDLSALKRLNAHNSHSARGAPKFLVPLGDKKLLASAGITNVEEMDWWETLDVSPNSSPDVRVTFAPTQHGSARGLFDGNKSLWGSYMIDVRGMRVYFGGDAAYSSHYREIRRRLGAPDISLLPIGAYEPRWFMKLVHMNPADAVQAHQDLGSRQSAGIHHGTFQLTEESIDAPVKELGKAMIEAGLDPASFSVQKEGVPRVHVVR